MSRQTNSSWEEPEIFLRGETGRGTYEAVGADDADDLGVHRIAAVRVIRRVEAVALTQGLEAIP